MEWPALVLSLRLAFATAGVLLLVGLPVAYWLAFSRRRGRALVEGLVALPLVLPPTVLGYYLLVGTGPESPLGRLLLALTGHALPFSFAGLLVGSVLYSLPFAVQPFTHAFTAVPADLIELSWCLGRSRWQTFRALILPLSWAGIVQGLALSFAHTLGELGVVLMIGGNIPGVTRTLSLAIYDDVQALDFVTASRASACLLILSFFTLALTFGLKRKTQTWLKPLRWK